MPKDPNFLLNGSEMAGKGKGYLEKSSPHLHEKLKLTMLTQDLYHSWFFFFFTFVFIYDNRGLRFTIRFFRCGKKKKIA